MKINTTNLKNINIPIRVAHSLLDANDRVDDLDIRIDTLNIDLKVSYISDIPLQDYSFNGIWNYKEIYELLCFSDVKTICGPIEEFLDEILIKIENSIIEQNLRPYHIIISAKRIGLIEGFPQLEIKKILLKKPSIDLHKKRNISINNYPLIISINNNWKNRSEIIEHPYLKTEKLKLSFSIDYKYTDIKDGNFAELINYDGIVKEIDKLNMQINGPIEQVLNKILSIIENNLNDNKKEFFKIKVEIEQNSFSRHTAVFVLEKYI